MTDEQKQDAETKVTQAEVIIVEKPPLLVMAIPACLPNRAYQAHP